MFTLTGKWLFSDKLCALDVSSASVNMESNQNKEKVDLMSDELWISQQLFLSTYQFYVSFINLQEIYGN